MESHILNIIKHYLKLLVIPGVIFLCSCENEFEKINLVTSSTEYPDVSGKKVVIIYSDSAKVRIKLVADELKKFSKAEKPYIEFPRGIEVTFFNDTLGVTAIITAGYAIYYNEARLWEARGNVIARNLEKGETLTSEELFWDENKGLIYSNIFTRVENKDDTFIGQYGFEADQNFNRYTFKGSRGTVKLKDEVLPK